MPGARTALRPVELVVSCEHGGNRVPAAYRRLFPPSVLASHRGYDPGALDLARNFARTYRAKLFYSTVTRLLVDLNRSEGHRQSFSRFVPRALKREVLASHHRPYRAALEAHVRTAIARGRRVVHLSCHSFAPRIRGVRRSADMGLLYDPGRRNERAFCTAWKASLESANPNRVVRLNYPYRGFADGLTTYLRTVFADDDYLGLELEVNQKHPRSGGARWAQLRRSLVASFAAPLGSVG
jgi:predicted N-formylglutamate amidohydrolase